MVTVTECCEHSLQHQETANEIEKKMNIYAICVYIFVFAISYSFWATICKMVCPKLSDHCLSVCLSVTLVYCGQTVG